MIYLFIWFFLFPLGLVLLTLAAMLVAYHNWYMQGGGDYD